MLDDNWETIGGPIAHQIEVLNAANQINVLDGLITFLLAHRGPFGNGNPPMPDEVALCHLHRAGTLFLLSDAGTYRNRYVDLRTPEDQIVYIPPEWQYVPALMQSFFRSLSSIWTSGNCDALDIASYALWRINWIHPFLNGNGRTARAFSYACLSLRLGARLPGRITMIDLITSEEHRPGYDGSLRAADEAVKAGKMPDLGPMKAFLNTLLQIQIQSAQAEAMSTAQPE